jgi:Cof subfamily protein (haloacid dehalogenase superfamily)
VSAISLVISDVDGTLVTTDKILTERSRDAVSRLDAVGIAFSIVSSRPPFGLRMLVEPLRLRLPIGGYNGGALVLPDLTVLEQHLLPPEAARQAIAVLRSFAVDIWAFAGDRWLVENPDGANIAREERTIHVRPTTVDRLEDHLEAITKLVGVSDDFERLTGAEPVARRTLGASASIARSQPYYLDITPAGTDKGVAVAGLARRLSVPAAEIATIGDMENDVAMFRQSGLSIAMGNASAEVKQLADAVTLSNDDDGFAAAVERLILPRARSGTTPDRDIDAHAPPVSVAAVTIRCAARDGD